MMMVMLVPIYIAILKFPPPHIAELISFLNNSPSVDGRGCSLHYSWDISHGHLSPLIVPVGKVMVMPEIFLYLWLILV